MNVGPRTWTANALCSAVLVSLLFGCIVLLQYTDITGRGLDLQGGSLVAANASRTIVAALLLTAFASGGGAALQLLRLDPKSPRRDPLAHLIYASFLGGALIGLAVVLLAFAGWLGIVAAICLLTPLLALAPWVLHEPAVSLLAKVRDAWTLSSARTRTAAAALSLLLCLLFSSLFVQRVLYPEAGDSDVWDHYLHYYHEVAQTGSLQPGEVWLHFYHSKGAGLFFLAVVLTGLFGAPLIAFLYVVLTSAIVFDIVSRVTRDRMWGLTATALLLMYLHVTYQVPSFAKHHVVLMAHLSLAFWIVVREAGLLDGGAAPPKRKRAMAYWIAGGVACFSMTFLVPQSLTLLLPALFLLTVGVACLQRRLQTVWPAATLAALATLGTGSAVLVNYTLTGLPEMAPAGLFWRLADQERFQQHWSPLVMQYYFCELEGNARASTQVDEQSGSAPDRLAWAAHLLRHSYFDDYVNAAGIVMAAIGLVSLSHLLLRWTPTFPWRVGGWLRRVFARDDDEGEDETDCDHLRGFRMFFPWRQWRFLLLVCLFLAGSMLPGIALAGADSLYRAYAFTGVFVVLACAVVWSMMFGRWRPNTSWLGLLAVGFCLLLPAKALLRFYPRETLSYAVGQVSTRDALSAISSSYELHTTFEDLVEARTHLPVGGRLLHLCYEPGPGYCLPAPVVVCEPSHSFAGRYEQLLFGSPVDAERTYRDLGINHFGVNLQAQLFLGLPYSPLFRGESLRENLTVAWRQGDYYLLTWRGPHDPAPPEEFLRGMAELQARENRFQRLYDGWVARRRTNTPTATTRIATHEEFHRDKH